MPRIEGNTEQPDGTVQNKQTEGSQAETHNRTGAEGSIESISPALLTHCSSTSVRINGNRHTNVSAENRSQSTNTESQGSGQSMSPAHLFLVIPHASCNMLTITCNIDILNKMLVSLSTVLRKTKEKNYNKAEDNNEDSKDLILSLKECLSTIRNVFLNLYKSFSNSGVIGSIATLSFHQSLLCIRIIYNVLNPKQ